RVARKITVLAEHNFAHQVVAQRVVAERFYDWLGIRDVALRLAHLLLLEEQPAVRENLFWEWQPGRHQKRRPVDGVESDDFLADHVQVRGPEFFELRAPLSVGAFAVADAG